MVQDFKTFIARGNVMDLAVAVIIGAAFGKIVASLTDDIIMPVVGKLFGGLDFSSYFVAMGPVPATFRGDPTSYAALKAAGVPLFGYGQFVTVVVNFLILAFIIFLMVRAANRALEGVKRREAEMVVAPAPEAADVLLLREILAELKAQRGA